MKIGKTGISPNFFAVTAFILILINQIWLCGLLLGFVLVVDNDSWLNKQILQALCLGLLANSIIGIVIILNIFSYIPIIGWFTDTAPGRFIWIIDVIQLIVIIIAIARCSKGTDAGIPVLSKWANWALGITEAKNKKVTEKSVEEKINKETAAEENTVEEKPGEEQTNEEQPGDEKSGEEKPDEVKTDEEKPGEVKLGEEK